MQRDLLGVLDTTVHLLALRFSTHWQTGELLPCALCDDLGPLPPQLKYIGWDVTPSSTIYVIERRAKRNIVTAVQRPKSESGWESENVLVYVTQQ
jgi:hypothetical protein